MALFNSNNMEQITVYSFSELSSDVQDKVLEKFADINYFDDWFDSVYEDAKMAGLKITGFDMDRRSIDIEFTNDALFTSGKILSSHGKMCDTYKLAQSFEADRDALVEKHSDGIHTAVVHEDNEDAFDTECDELEADFLQALGEEYLSMLEQQYEYLGSREAIIETIEANEYLFTENGKRI